MKNKNARIIYSIEIMTNLSTTILILIALICFGAACQNNPLSKFTKKYNCTIEGEPEPQTSEDFVNRAVKHIKLFSGEDATSLDDCAFDALDEAIRLNPNNYRALFLRGFGYRQKKFFSEALEDFGKAIEVNPRNHETYNYRAKIYAESREYQKAIEDMTKAIESAPTGYFLLEDYYYDRGDYYFQSSQFEKALSDLNKAISFDYHNAVYYSKRAEIYKQLGKEDLAKSDEAQAEFFKNEKTNSNSNTQPPKNLPKSISGGVLNGKAINLVKPSYPPAAKAVKATGAVNVQVELDENGNVVSAKAVNGHPLLRPAAESAARASKFAPTMLSGQKVQVTGILVFNFEEQL
jgi:TonB family protein